MELLETIEFEKTSQLFFVVRNVAGPNDEQVCKWLNDIHSLGYFFADSWTHFAYEIRFLERTIRSNPPNERKNWVGVFGYDCFYHGQCDCRDSRICPMPTPESGACEGCIYDWNDKHHQVIYEWLKTHGCKCYVLHPNGTLTLLAPKNLEVKQEG